MVSIAEIGGPKVFWPIALIVAYFSWRFFSWIGLIIIMAIIGLLTFAVIAGGVL
tara:strand:+ start:301 stop:462 length:162 start_codon:yes stop_codon:yes gene_type:complete